MRFPVDLLDSDAAMMLSSIKGMGTPKAWKRRAETFDLWVRQNSLMDFYLSHQFGIERGIIRALKYKEATNRAPRPAGDPEIFSALQFCTLATRVGARVSATARHELCGKIRGALSDKKGLADLDFELSTIAHLIKAGFDVELNDLEGLRREGKNFDFLAARNGISIAIECKSFSYDVGRKIHRRRLYDLSGLISNSLSRALDQEGGTFVKVTLADSLRPGDLGKVAGEISETLRAGTAPPDCSFVSGCEAFDVAASPIGPDAHLGVSQDEVEEFISRRFGFSTPHLLVSFRPNKAAVIVGVRSLKAR